MQLPKSMPSPWRKSAPRIRRSRSAVPKAGLLIVVLLAACFLGACKDKNAKGTVLAQVGNSTLSLEELRESFPAEYEQLIRREQYLDFIKRWIDDEVLYQQALKAHLDDDPLVKRKLDKLMRKLLIEEFLAREGASEGFEADETTMNQYYEMHKERFRRKVPEVKYTHIRVQTLKQANELRNRVGSDNAFLAQAATHSLDPVPEALDALPFKKERELPACFAAEVAAARIGAVTAPASCPDGVYLVRVLDRQETGSTIPFAEAKEEIATTLAMQRKDKLLEARIAEYKAGTAISYNLDQIPGLAENSPAPAAAGPSDSAAPATADAPAATATGSLAADPQPDIHPTVAADPLPPKPSKRKSRPAKPTEEIAPPTPSPTPIFEPPAEAPSPDVAPAQPQEVSPDAQNPYPQ